MIDRRNLEKLARDPITLSVVLGERTMSLESLLEYRPGSILVLGKPSSARVSVRAGETDLGEGTVVQVGDQLAVRMDEVRVTRELLEDLAEDESSP